MAEIVDLSCQELILDLRELSTIGIVTNEEASKITLKRREHEYKLASRIKRKEDYLNYINYEISVLKFVVKKRKIKGIKTSVHNVEYRLKRHICTLFKQAIDRFNNDYTLWTSYFHICKENKLHTIAKSMIPNFVKTFSHRPNAWVFAAKWESDECYNYEGALKYLLQGMRNHPQSTSLYTTAICCEVKRIELEYDETEEDQTDVFQSPTAVCLRSFYESGMETFPGLNFLLEVYDEVKNFTSLTGIKEKILDDMQTKYGDDARTWKRIASSAYAEIVKPDAESSKESVENCIKIYEKGIENVPTTDMWTYYIEFLRSITFTEKPFAIWKLKHLKLAFLDAMNRGKLSENLYVAFIELITTNVFVIPVEAVNIIFEKATEHFPMSESIWKAKLDYYIRVRDNTEEIERTYQQILELSKETNSILPINPFFHMMFNYYKKSNSSQITRFLESSLNNNKLSSETKPLYLDWISAKPGGNFNEVKTLFTRLRSLGAPNLELLNKMIEILQQQYVVNVTDLRRVHEMTCTQFGKTNIDVWIKYLEFEVEQGQFIRVNALYDRASKELTPTLSAEFATTFQLNRTEVKSEE